MDGGAWWAAVHVVTEGQTRLRDFTFTSRHSCYNRHHLEEKKKSLVQLTNGWDIFYLYFFIWLCQILVATHRIFDHSCSM